MRAPLVLISLRVNPSNMSYSPEAPWLLTRGKLADHERHGAMMESWFLGLWEARPTAGSWLLDQGRSVPILNGCALEEAPAWNFIACRSVDASAPALGGQGIARTRLAGILQ